MCEYRTIAKNDIEELAPLHVCEAVTRKQVGIWQVKEAFLFTYQSEMLQI